MSLGQLSYKQARMLKKEGFTLTEEGWTLGLPERLLFEFDQSEVKEKQTGELVRLSRQLHQYKLQKLKVIGHTDSTGEANYNQQLSEKRAQTVAVVFENNGFKPENIQAIGRGSSQPLFENDSEEHRASNRRVNIIIIP